MTFHKVNPFAPNSPVNPGMFVGRINELIRLEGSLIQARAARPVNFLITGERGIGKSSLLNYLKWVAEGVITTVSEAHLRFLVVDTDIDANTTNIGLIQKIRLGIDSALAKHETTRSFLKEAWTFLQRVEVGGVKLKSAERTEAEELLVEQFSYALADLATRITGKEQSLFGTSFDGILILIDEADNASKPLSLGSFLKLLSERLQRRGCGNVIFGLAGLPRLREALMESHPSSLRLFDEVPLGALLDDEVGRVVDLCITKANTLNPVHTVITSEARAALIYLSEGLPHFVQQFGYSAFATATNDIIEGDDVMMGAFQKGGALDLIGDRYYRDDFYNKVQSEAYRHVLRIMADHGKEWIAKEILRVSFKGKESTLTNAIKALLDRKIIVSKEGAVGVYRLQHRGFAAWIKLYTADQAALKASVEGGGSGSERSGT